jgi:hypothetical protein
MHHKYENRGHMVTTKNVHFVKLSKYVTDLTIAYMGRPIWGSDERVMPLRKYLSGLSVLPVRDQLARK